MTVRNILRKELKLSASKITFLFIVFGLMFLLPGYPILVGAFFVTQGIFHSFQAAREANDIVFSALLPIAKTNVVRGKYLFVCFVECCALVLMAAAVGLRMTVFRDALPYRMNALMNANFFALGAAMLIFGLFNLIFVGGFFKTAYRFSGPFVRYIIAAVLAIGAAEAAHHFPGLQPLNAFGTEHFALQLTALCAGIVVFVLLTLFSCSRASRNFEKVDL